MHYLSNNDTFFQEKLNYHLGFSEVFPEFFRGAIFFLPEDSVKVGQVVEPALVAYFGN